MKINSSGMCESRAHRSQHSALSRVRGGLLASLLLGAFLFGACGRGNAQDHATSIKDNFASDKQLDHTLWQIHTPLLTALANAENSGLVEPQLLFDQSGMRMAGVNGTYRFTGVQSKLSFSPPFTVRATVMGAVAHGNAFVFYVAGNDLHQSLKVEANLNLQNGLYRGL